MSTYCPSPRSATDDPWHWWILVHTPAASATVAVIPPYRICVRCGQREDLP